MSRRFLTRHCPACGCDAKTKQQGSEEVYFRHRRYQADREYCINSNEPIDRPYVPDARGVFHRHEGRTWLP